MTDEQYIQVAKDYFERRKIPYGKFWCVRHFGDRVTVWFWRASEDRATNPSCTMNADGSYPTGSE